MSTLPFLKEVTLAFRTRITRKMRHRTPTTLTLRHQTSIEWENPPASVTKQTSRALAPQRAIAD